MNIASAVVGTVESNPVNPVTISNFRLKIIHVLRAISHLVEVVTYGSLAVVIYIIHVFKKENYNIYKLLNLLSVSLGIIAFH